MVSEQRRLRMGRVRTSYSVCTLPRLDALNVIINLVNLLRLGYGFSCREKWCCWHLCELCLHDAACSICSMHVSVCFLVFGGAFAQAYPGCRSNCVCIWREKPAHSGQENDMGDLLRAESSVSNAASGSESDSPSQENSYAHMDEMYRQMELMLSQLGGVSPGGRQIWFVWRQSDHHSKSWWKQCQGRRELRLKGIWFRYMRKEFCVGCPIWGRRWIS